MFINFNLGGEVYDGTYTIYLGEQPIKQFKMSAPRFALEGQFIALVQEIAQQKQPMRLVMEREEVIWNQFEQNYKTLHPSVEFMNYEAAAGR